MYGMYREISFKYRYRYIYKYTLQAGSLIKVTNAVIIDG